MSPNPLECEPRHVSTSMSSASTKGWCRFDRNMCALELLLSRTFAYLRGHPTQVAGNILSLKKILHALMIDTGSLFSPHGCGRGNDATRRYRRKRETTLNRRDLWGRARARRARQGGAWCLWAAAPVANHYWSQHRRRGETAAVAEAKPHEQSNPLTTMRTVRFSKAGAHHFTERPRNKTTASTREKPTARRGTYATKPPKPTAAHMARPLVCARIVWTSLLRESTSSLIFPSWPRATKPWSPISLRCRIRPTGLRARDARGQQ